MGSRNAQPSPDVLAGFSQSERGDLAAQPDPLLELPKLGETELGFEFRLTHQQDLQQLIRRGLEVREQSDLFQRRGVQVLGFVEHEDSVLAGPRPIDEEVIQCDESLCSRVPPRGDPQILKYILENAVKRQRGIEDKGDRGLSVELLTKGVKQRGLSRTHLAGQGDEASSLLDAVQELGERLPVRRTHVEKSGIRGRVEGLLRDTVKL